MHERTVNPTSGKGTTLKAAIVLGATLLTVVICWIVPPAKAGGEAGVVMDLPAKIDNLYSFPETVSAGELQILPPDTTFARKTYGNLSTQRLNRILLSIILSGAEKRSIHRPERCLPSQGWHIDATHTENIPLASGHGLDVTVLLLSKPVTLQDGQSFTLRSYYLYWFIGKDVTTASATKRILMTNWDLLVHRVNQRWAYVIASANITKDFDPNGLDQEQTLAMLKQFIHDSVPSYMITEMPKEQTATR